MVRFLQFFPNISHTNLSIKYPCRHLWNSRNYSFLHYWIKQFISILERMLDLAHIFNIYLTYLCLCCIISNFSQPIKMHFSRNWNFGDLTPWVNQVYVSAIKKLFFSHPSIVNIYSSMCLIIQPTLMYTTRSYENKKKLKLHYANYVVYTLSL